MKNMWEVESRKGFTLVELSLSIAFISILSITVALITNDAISTYRRGLTLNQVNTVGMDLVDDIRVAVQGSPSKAVVGECLNNYSGSSSEKIDAKSACEGDGAQKFVVFNRKADVGEMRDVPVYGAFCTGAYSYIWNSGYFYSEEYNMGGINRATLKYKNKDGDDASADDFRLLKVRDQQRAVCKIAIDANYGQADIDGGVIDISSYGNVGEDPEVILANDIANSLALYDLGVASPAANSLGNSLFYSISFILGTVQGGINVMSTGNFCKTPTEYNSNFDYCAINKFNFAVQATGG